MFNSQRPSTDDLPTTRQLLRATGIAAISAGAILVAVVWPSEYGIDPTGAGRVFGLTEMGEIKQQLALEAAADAASAQTAAIPVANPQMAASEPAGTSEMQSDGARSSWRRMWALHMTGRYRGERSITIPMPMRPAFPITLMTRVQVPQARAALSWPHSTAATVGSGATVPVAL